MAAWHWALVKRTSGISPNASGEIQLTLTQGPNNDNDTGFIYLGAMTIAAVPEPGVWALLAGAIALGLVVWRRRVWAMRVKTSVWLLYSVEPNDCFIENFYFSCKFAQMNTLASMGFVLRDCPPEKGK